MGNTVHTMFARYNQTANEAVFGILSKLSNEERERERGSYYKSLSGLARHLSGCTRLFSSLFSAALKGKPAAKPLEAAANLPAYPEGQITEAQWKEVAAANAKVDAAIVAFCEGLSEADLKTPVKWITPNPPTLPLSMVLYELAVHNTHHRGQISQILDELKIDNDYSGIPTGFTPAA